MLLDQSAMALVLLDRDGVINDDSPSYVKTPAEWSPISGSLEAIARLNQAGRIVAICSNQAGVARGVMSAEDLDAIHARMHVALERIGGRVDRIYCCTHAPGDHCACRKPKPGLLLRAMRELRASPDQTRFVGDSLRDIRAAMSAGCTPVLVRTGKGAIDENEARKLGIELIFDDLAAATDWLLAS